MHIVIVQTHVPLIAVEHRMHATLTITVAVILRRQLPVEIHIRYSVVVLAIPVITTVTLALVGITQMYMGTINRIVVARL